MDVPSATIDPDEAKGQLAQYRTIKSPNEEERAIIAALVAAVAGRSLVNLPEAIRSAGSFDDGCPRLAAMVPTYAWCYVTRTMDGTVTFRAEPTTEAKKKMVVAPGFRPMERDALSAAHLDFRAWSRERRRTQVPLVPPQHRVRGWMTKCLVLWEVEEWATTRIPRPPGDPMLLRHLIDDLYSVEATWDLTPLEQMVLGART